MESQALAAKPHDHGKPEQGRVVGHSAVVCSPRSDAPGASGSEQARPDAELRDHAWQPRLVVLFSGHRVDEPGRATPRFPLEKVPIAEAAIGQALHRIGAGPGDLALTQGASGGDLIFAEACLTRGIRLQLLQPFPEAEFIQRSVTPSAGDWGARYRAVTAKLSDPVRCLQEHGPSDADPYERCNLWLLDTALAFGPERVRLLCLWDGGGGDGPGGTRHMVQEVQKRNGQVIWLDTRTLW